MARTGGGQPYVEPTTSVLSVYDVRQLGSDNPMHQSMVLDRMRSKKSSINNLPCIRTVAAIMRLKSALSFLAIAPLSVTAKPFASFSNSDMLIEPGALIDNPPPSDTEDNFFSLPYIDIDEWRDTPIRHRYVHGGFNTSDLRLDMFPGLVAQIPGFRGSSVAASYSRTIAVELYGDKGHRPYGYVFGGSGGAYKTLACFEQTTTWDGSVPFIVGSPISIPNVFTVQAHAMRILMKKFPQIVDAIEPGGSGDMYKDLNEEEAGALKEVTSMGFPPTAWFRYDKISTGYTGVFSSLLDMVIGYDPGYFEDFWKKPGYLGYQPPESLTKDRVNINTTIKRVIGGQEALAMGLPVSLSGSFGGGTNDAPAAFQLTDIPTGNVQGSTLRVTSGLARGIQVYLSGLVNDIALIGFGASGFADIGVFAAGDALSIDNSVYLAYQTYHRHQDPGPQYPVWDQFKKDGEPIYPQRPLMTVHAPILSGTGVNQTGKFAGKMIVVEAMLDEAAFPWQGDWYAARVRESLGAATDDQFRLWMVDRCMHTSPAIDNKTHPAETTRLVSYLPVIQQALRDLIYWVEKDTPASANTNYKFEDGQILLPATAAERAGIQPVVTLRVINGTRDDRADVKVGQTVSFAGTIVAPPGTGDVVGATFDFDGVGTFPVTSEMSFVDGESKESAEVKETVTFEKAGTYFPALRGVSQRQMEWRAGNSTSSGFAKVVGLGRVRVVVS
ncbi:hypothetical protein K402DRAFT_450456 [Aulographum hederae CBS 113979]|uniref:Uncharacterized protein n=1 Tax=Aulographum hederae CBS 113979 TaxID=1176131 RepID=A0A6G1HEP8_9PEZI|nr:hypothetical protein K402DRAFT_450456 [Aulographum hederae CBS 113979]